MEIRFIKKAEWDKLSAFNKLEYRPDHILANKRYYNWQYDNVFNKDKTCYTTLGIFEKNGELVGTFGLSPAPFSFFGKKVMGSSLCNLIIKKDLRSLGYGYLLLEAASQSADLAIDHGINKSAWPLFEKSGWLGGDLKRFFYIINSEQTESLIGDSTAKITVSKQTNVKLAGASFKEVGLFDEVVDEFWSRVKNKYPITVERSADYLNWRYANHPLLDYKVFIGIMNGRVESVAVVRIEAPETYRIAHLVDFISSNEWEEYSLGQVIEYCIKEKIDFIDHFFSGNFHLSSLHHLGFIDGDREPYNRIPMLLNPIDRVKRTKINFATKLINKNLPTAKAENLDNWYTTKGGGDQDRPS